MYWNLAILALFVFSYSLIAGWVERTPLTGPILYTLFGLALGPVGLASIVFAIIVLGTDLPDGLILAMVVACTVILSIVAHGPTANPLVKTFGR